MSCFKRVSDLVEMMYMLIQEREEDHYIIDIDMCEIVM